MGVEARVGRVQLASLATSSAALASAPQRSPASHDPAAGSRISEAASTCVLARERELSALVGADGAAEDLARARVLDGAGLGLD